LDAKLTYVYDIPLYRCYRIREWWL